MKTIILSTTLAVAFAAFAAGPVYAQAPAGDATKGEAVFKRCASCHAVGEGAANKVGPELNDVVGRVAGSLEGFNYSPALKEAGAGGLTWTPDQLAEWLKDPKAKVPGNKMAFPGLKNEADVANVIAYLTTFSPNAGAATATPDAAAPAAPAPAAPAQ